MKLADDDTAAVTQVLTDYYTAFSTLDAQAVLPYFHEPSQLVSPGGVVPTPTRAAVAAAFQRVIDGLRTNAEWQIAMVAIHDAEDALRPEQYPRQRPIGPTRSV